MPRDMWKRMKGWPVVLTIAVVVLSGIALATWPWNTPVVVMQSIPAAATGMAAPYYYLPSNPDPEDHPQDLQDNRANLCEPSSALGSGSAGPGLHVNIATGNVWTRVPILTMYGCGEDSFDLTFTYNSICEYQSTHHPWPELGRGSWTHSYNIYWYEVPEMVDYPNHYPARVVVVDGDGRRNVFAKPSSPPPGGHYLLRPAGRNFSLWCIQGGENPEYRLDFPDGTVWKFGTNHRIKEIVNPRGLTTSFAYQQQGVWNYLTEIVDGYGHRVCFTYDDVGTHIWTPDIPDSGETTVMGWWGSTGFATPWLLSITDPSGNTVSFEYEQGTPWTMPNGTVYPLYRLTRETLRNGRSFTCAYSDMPSGEGSISTRTIRDSGGDTVVSVSAPEFTMPGRPMLSQGAVTLTDGQAYQFVYWRNWWWQLQNLEITPTQSDPTYYSYAEYGRDVNHPELYNRLKSTSSWFTWDNIGPTRYYDWYPTGMLKKVTDELSNETSYEYGIEDFPQLLTKKIEPGGAVWTYHYDAYDGATPTHDLSDVTDPNNCLTHYDYTYYAADAETLPGQLLPGRIHTVTKTDRRGYHTTWTYDARGGLANQSIEVGGGKPNIEIIYEHDGLGRRTIESVQRGDGTAAVSKYEYDSAGRLSKTIEAYAEGQPPNSERNLTTQYTYDGHGLIKTVSSPRGVVTKYEYDYRNRPTKIIEDFRTDGANRTTENHYDGSDNVTAVTDPNGNVSTFVFDAFKHVIKSVDAEGYVTLFGRDTMGNTETWDRGLVRGDFDPSNPTAKYDHVWYEYDKLGRVRVRHLDSNVLNLTTQCFYKAQACGCGGVGGGIPWKIINEKAGYTYQKLDLFGRITRISRPFGVGGGGEEPDSDDAFTTFEYDEEGNVKSVTGPEKEKTQYAYDGAGRRLSQRRLADPNNPSDANDLVTQYQWDGASNLTGVTLPNGHELTAVYDGAGRLQHILDGSGLDKLAEYTYDPDGNVLTQKDGEGRTWTYVYDRLGRVTQEYDPLHPPPTYMHTEYTYDNVGNLVWTRNVNWVQTKREYDHLNRLVKVVEDAMAEVEPIPGDTRVLLDGEAEEGTQGEGVLVVGDAESGGSNNVMGPPRELMEVSTPTWNTTTEYIYDGSRLTEIKDHDGNTTHYDYDGAGRLTATTYPLGSGGGTGNVRFAYSNNGNGKSSIVRTDQRSITTTWSLDELGHLSWRDYSGHSEKFVFDRSGRLKEATRRAPTNPPCAKFTMTRSYDGLGRPLQEVQAFAGGPAYSTNLTYAIDLNTVTMSWTMNTPAGRQVRHTLDRLGRLVEAAMLGGDGTTMAGATWLHNLAGQRTWATRANGPLSRTGYEYDGNGRLTTLMHAINTGGGDPTMIAGMTYGYDIIGNRTFSRNSMLSDRSERYGHDNLNRLTVMDRGVLNAAGTAVTTPLSHPILNSNQQWADLDRRGNWLDYRWSITQGEEPNQTTGTAQQTRHANGVNEYTNFVALDPAGLETRYATAHDLAGNLTFDSLAPNVGADAPAGQRYVYDEENRVIEVKRDSDGATLANYEYDALGRRVHTIEYVDAATGSMLETARKTRHVYAGLETIEEYEFTSDASGNDVTSALLREFVWGDPGRFPEPLALVVHDGGDPTGQGGGYEPPSVSTYHYLHDALGTVIGLTDASGTLVERYTYDPYGKAFIERWDAAANEGAGAWVTSSVGGASTPAGGLCYSALGNPFMWTAQRYDAGTGLYAFLNRTYSPGLGRWLQRDPIGYAGGLNLYEYVLGSPIGWTDPLGLDPQWHHYFPQAIFRELEIEGGLDIDAAEFGIMVEGNEHIGKGGLHSKGWNEEWGGRIRDRIKSGEALTKDWAVGQLNEMKGLGKFKEVLAKSQPATARFSGKKTGPGIFGKVCQKTLKDRAAKAATGAAALGLLGFLASGVGLIDALGGEEDEGGGQNECAKFASQLSRGQVSNTQCETCASSISEKTGRTEQGLLFSKLVCSTLPPDGTYPVPPPPKRTDEEPPFVYANTISCSPK